MMKLPEEIIKHQEQFENNPDKLFLEIEMLRQQRLYAMGAAGQQKRQQLQEKEEDNEHIAAATVVKKRMNRRKIVSK